MFQTINPSNEKLSMYIMITLPLDTVDGLQLMNLSAQTTGGRAYEKPSPATLLTVIPVPE